MKRRTFLPLLLAVPAAALLGHQVIGQNAPQTSNATPSPLARAKYVFVVSFDGGKPAVMKQSKMPLTMAMAEQGAATWEAQTIYPSITLPSHTSMVTGVGPDKHQILWNDYKPERGPVKVTTMFKEAKARGLKTALFAGKEKFKHFDVPNSLDKIEVPEYSAKAVAGVASKYIVSEKPNLCFVHFADSDGAGHKYGWGSPEQIKSFADEDEALKMLRDAADKAGIASESVFILTADHGGHDKTHGSRSPEDMTIPWIVFGKGVKPGTKITAPVTTYDSAATALWLLGVPVPAEWDGKPVTSAFKE